MSLTPQDNKRVRIKDIPFLICFLDHALFPVMSNQKLNLLKLKSIFKNKEINLYEINSQDLIKEIDLVSDFINHNSVTVYNPYRFPYVEISKSPIQKFLVLYLQGKGIKVNEINIPNILLNNSSFVNIELDNLIPSNIKLTRFPSGWKPFVVIYKKPTVLQKEYSLGRAYWGNILLFQNLLGDDLSYKLLKNIRGSKRYLDDIKLISEPVVLVDVEDEFINNILKYLEEHKVNDELSTMIFRYFKYVSFLPFVISDLSSCLIFLEILTKIETNICKSIGFEQFPPILQRMGEMGKIYLDYLNKADDLFDVRRI